MTRVYYRRASACLVMFDVAQPNSFHNAAKWKKDLDTKCFNSSGENIPCVLVANKVSKCFLKPQCSLFSHHERNATQWTDFSIASSTYIIFSMIIDLSF
jgi:Ras-related protein Rab-7L1